MKKSDLLKAEPHWLVAIVDEQKYLWFNGTFEGWCQRMQRVNKMMHGPAKIRESIPGEWVIDLGGN